MNRVIPPKITNLSSEQREVSYSAAVVSNDGIVVWLHTRSDDHYPIWLPTRPTRSTAFYTMASLYEALEDDDRISNAGIYDPDLATIRYVEIISTETLQISDITEHQDVFA